MTHRAFQQAGRVLSVTLRGATVIFDVERGTYESLNAVASSVWELLATTTPFETIVNTMQANYELPPDVPADQMMRDIAALLARLERSGIIISEPVT